MLPTLFSTLVLGMYICDDLFLFLSYSMVIGLNSLNYGIGDVMLIFNNILCNENKQVQTLVNMKKHVQFNCGKLYLFCSSH
jgi:hypothetical protein